MSELRFWDDEVEELADRAAAIMGEDVLLDATDRVIRRLVTAATGPISGAAVRDALKVELRRLLKPH